ncbi:MAG: hypothetical protein E6G94_13995 [Alphaproteobacteria bacterium]|nr:MAG: hypothetical protein E6G94_13995 [Alphaproteobacteria bacterium]
MAAIERSVILPKDAEPLDAYGRNYAFAGPDMVVAIYLLPERPSNPDSGCEELREDMTSRPCSKKDLEEMARDEAARLAAQTPAGERRWHKDPNGLPQTFDGGCTQVNVRFRISTRSVERVACNGRA